MKNKCCIGFRYGCQDLEHEFAWGNEPEIAIDYEEW